MSADPSPQGTVRLPPAERDAPSATPPPAAPPGPPATPLPPPAAHASGATVMLDRASGDQAPPSDEARERALADTLDASSPRSPSVPDATPSGPLSAGSGELLAGKYRLVKLLGQGGMGSVYEARHVEIGRRVAVKLVSTEVGGQQETIDRFRREARATGAIDSEHIVQVFDAGYDPARGLYMAMELLRGCDLATALARVERLEVDAACALAVQVALGLQAAHETGIVHRDLKPANIFLVPRSDGSLLVKLVDFGIAKVLDETHAPGPVRSLDETPPHQTALQPGLTRHGSVVGTPQYMSPEQAQGLPVDHRSDLYSLGAVLHEALAGMSMVPLLETYEQTVVHLMTHPEPPLLRVRCPAAPEALERLLASMVAHEPGHRPVDIGHVITSLLAIRPALATLPLRIEGLELEATSRPGRKFSHPSLAGLADAHPASSPVASVPSSSDDSRRVPLRPSSRLAMGVSLAALLVVGAIGAWVNRSPAVDPVATSPTAPAPSSAALPARPPSSALPVVALVASVPPPPAGPSASARPAPLVKNASPGPAVRPAADAPTAPGGERKIGGAGLAEKF